MTVTLAAITVDCDDAHALARFWSAALDRPLASEPNPTREFALIGRADHGVDPTPSWMFARVPEPKSAKNRMHVDLVAEDRAAEIDRLVALGAVRGADKDEWGKQWTVMADPEGNEFCVAQA